MEFVVLGFSTFALQLGTFAIDPVAPVARKNADY